MVSNKQHEELKDFYDRELERLTRDRDYWRHEYSKCVVDCIKTDVYKSILEKQGIIGEAATYTDEAFVFEGKVYRPVSYHLDMEPGRPVGLTVDFVRVKEEK